MPFVPDFAEIGESQIVDKMMVVVERDMKPALDYFYLDTPTYTTRYGVANPTVVVGEDLSAFAAMTREEAFFFPLLILGNERMTSKTASSGEWLNQELTVGAGIVVKDTKVSLANKLAEKYVRAFKAVVRKDIEELLPSAELLTDFDGIDIDHQYLRYGKTPDGAFTQPVEFAIRIRFGEK